jgi:hypothetical protein
MDSLEYIFGPLLHMFDGLSQDELLSRAEYWLVDRWKAPQDVHHWVKEPRKGRYDDRQFQLHSSYKGSMPVIERFADYLDQ